MSRKEAQKAQERTITYHAVFRKGTKEPVALFLEEQDAREWHDNPALYSQGRRRLCFGRTLMVDGARAEQLLRGIVLGPDEELGRLLEQAREFLNGG